jgi:hypothetical protein
MPVGTLITDIFVTVKDRYDLATRSIRSLLDNTDKTQYRLTVTVDGNWKHSEDDYGLPSKLSDMHQLRFLLERHADYIIQSRENEGLGPTINRAVAHVKSINDWYSHPTHGDQSKVAPLITMCQDDLLYSKDWLGILASRFFAYEKIKNLGFASGVECVEHPVREILGKNLVTKDWIRASQMMARREYWASLMPIPRFDPETGRVRAKPNDGMGSGVDWWLIRNHENSVCKSGRTNLVVPGLVVHAGYDKSTWLERELPESDADKATVKERL